MGVVLGLLHQGPIGSSRIDHLLLRLLPASLRHGWTPLRVDLWLDRLGLWDQEL